MNIAGGTYGERCLYPRWDHIYGSGLRAAVALAEVSPGSILHSYVPRDWHADVEATLYSLGLKGQLKETDGPITFSYLHTFKRMEIAEDAKLEPPITVAGDVVLRFGMMEGDAKVSGDRVVYDPQSSPDPFSENGSQAGSLAVIVTQFELLDLASRSYPGPSRHMSTMERLREGVIALREQTPGLKITLVKDGLGGLIVFRGDEPTAVPTYAAETYFRVGSGDVIAAAFAHGWGELKLDPDAAADYAARCAAYFVEGPRLPLPAPSALSGRALSATRKEQLRIVGIGDFELQALVLETEEWLKQLGGSVRYKAFEAGVPSDAVDLVLVGSRSTRRQLELISATAAHPAVVFWPGNGSELAREMFPGAVVAADYATALYHAMRTSRL